MLSSRCVASAFELDAATRVGSLEPDHVPLHRAALGLCRALTTSGLNPLFHHCWSIDKTSVCANRPNRSVSLLERAMRPAPLLVWFVDRGCLLEYLSPCGWAIRHIWVILLV